VQSPQQIDDEAGGQSMSADFDVDDEASRLRVIIRLVAFGVVTVLFALFGHPSKVDWVIGGGVIVYIFTMDSLEDIERRVKRVESKMTSLQSSVQELQARMLEKMSEDRDELRDGLRELQEKAQGEVDESREDIENVGQMLLGELRDVHEELQGHLRPS
jgi:hypothetical protein